MRLPETEIERIKWAGLLHDIGKIGIRDNVLLKEGPLDKSERILMNQHPTIGAEIVAPASQLSNEAPLIRAHHEWFNGSGYPDGREALDIPLGARILTIADAYEAMTSSRPYRKTPLTHEHGRRPAREVHRHPVRPGDRADPGRPRPRHPRPAARPPGRAADHAPSTPPTRRAPVAGAATTCPGLGRCFLAPSSSRSSWARWPGAASRASPT